MNQKISNFELLNTIDDNGATSIVVQARDTSEGAAEVTGTDKRALKIMREDISEAFKQSYQDEINALTNLKNQNVIQMFESGTQKLSSGTERNYLVLEVAQTDFFELQRVDGVFKESVARHYFRQLIQGLQYCHSQGFAHRDIKPQNLLLGFDQKLKLSDFGFAHDLKESKLCNQYLGTSGFMSPQIESRSEPYNPVSSDLFAAGVCLFIWIAGHLPFEKATKNDPHYLCFSKNRPDLFWKCHNNRLTKKHRQHFSDELKDLLNKLFAKEEDSRLQSAE